MRRLFIPEIGTEITLAEHCTLTIYPERRNHKLLEKLGYTGFPTFWPDDTGLEEYVDFCLTSEQDAEFDELFAKSQKNTDDFDRETWTKERKKFYQKYKDVLVQNVPLLLVDGTVLKVDRIYIRKGNKEYSSLTFYAKNGPYKGQRFWAKLDEVNQLIIE